MIEVFPYESHRKNEWDNFVDSSRNGTFMLKRDYMDYHSDRFHDQSIMIYDENKLAAVFPANLNEHSIYSHQGLTYGGVIYSQGMKCKKGLECFEALISYYQSLNIKKIIYKRIPHIYHSYPSEEDVYALFVNKATLIRRDASSAICLENPIAFERGRQRGIKKAQTLGLNICPTNDYNKVISIIDEFLENRHQKRCVHRPHELEILHSRFPSNIKLWGAFYEENMISCAVMFETTTVSHAQYIFSTDFGKEVGANDIMNDYLISLAKREGKKYYDYGISTENNGYILNEGLIAQKEMFGARTICYDWYEINI